MKALHTAGFQPLKKKKKKKEKKKSGFYMKNSPMPSLKLGRFNLAKARLRGCFSNGDLEPKAKKAKATMNSLRSYFSKAKALDSKNYRAASILKAVFKEGE